MLNFKITTNAVELEYKEDQWGNAKWVLDELTAHNEVRLSRVFYFDRGDLLNPPTSTQDPGSHTYRFQLGIFNGDYLEIPARILDIKNDVHIDRAVKVW